MFALILIVLALLYVPAFGQMAAGMAPEILRSGPQHQPPVEAMHLFDEAEVLIAQEKYDEAILAFDNATKLDPQYMLVLCNTNLAN